MRSMALCSLHRPRTVSSSPCHFINPFNRWTRSLSQPTACMDSRSISTFRPLRQDLYDIIEVPRTASKHQIKSSFYKLSKMYHPDLNHTSDKEAEAKFIAVSNAWAILGDDRRRRAYDRSLDEANTPSPTRSSSSASAWNLGRDDLRRRSRATYAWDRHRHSGPFRDAPEHGRSSFGAGGHYRGPEQGSHTYYTEFARGNARSGRTGTAKRKANEAMEELDRKNSKLQADNGVWRFAQVFGVFLDSTHHGWGMVY